MQLFASAHLCKKHLPVPPCPCHAFQTVPSGHFHPETPLLLKRKSGLLGKTRLTWRSPEAKTDPAEHLIKLVSEAALLAAPLRGRTSAPLLSQSNGFSEASVPETQHSQPVDSTPTAWIREVVRQPPCTQGCHKASFTKVLKRRKAPPPPPSSSTSSERALIGFLGRLRD